MLPEVVNIEQVINIVEERLHNDFDSEVEVTQLKPGERIETFTTSHNTGSLIVYYDGSSHDGPEDESLVIQDVKMRIGIYIQLRLEKGFRLRDELVQRIKKSLAGIRYNAVSRMEKIIPASDEYLAPEADRQLQYIEHNILFVAPTEFKETNYKQYN